MRSDTQTHSRGGRRWGVQVKLGGARHGVVFTLRRWRPPQGRLRRLLVALWQGEGVRRERRVLDGLLRLLRLRLRFLWLWVWLWLWLLLLPPARRLGARRSRARG